MAANSTHEVATTADEGLGMVVLDRLGQMFCGLHGHDHMLQFEGGRMFLRCLSCGHESPGWDVPKRVPVLKFGKGDRSAPVHTVPTRRVA